MSTLIAGSLKLFMDEYVNMLGRVADRAYSADGYDLPRPRVYRWKRGNMELPCIYNWLNTSPGEYRDVTSHRHRDTLNIVTRIAAGRLEEDDDTNSLELYGDCFRELVDRELRLPQPLSNTCKWAERPSMNMAADEIDGSAVLVVEFAVLAQLDRIIDPNPS